MNTAPSVIRVVVADDHPIVRLGVCALLKQASDIQVVGEAENHIVVRDIVTALRPDVVLMDIEMSGPCAWETGDWMREHYPATKTLVFTGHNDDAYIAQMLAVGVQGFLIKSIDDYRLIASIRQAAQGQSLFDSQQLHRAYRWQRDTAVMWSALTHREREVLFQMAEGCSNSEIALRLGLSENTVANHVKSLKRKLNLRSRTMVATWPWRFGVLYSSPLTFPGVKS